MSRHVDVQIAKICRWLKENKLTYHGKLNGEFFLVEKATGNVIYHSTSNGMLPTITPFK